MITHEIYMLSVTTRGCKLCNAHCVQYKLGIGNRSWSIINLQIKIMWLEIKIFFEERIIEC